MKGEREDTVRKTDGELTIWSDREPINGNFILVLQGGTLHGKRLKIVKVKLFQSKVSEEDVKYPLIDNNPVERNPKTTVSQKQGEKRKGALFSTKNEDKRYFTEGERTPEQGQQKGSGNRLRNSGTRRKTKKSEEFNGRRRLRFSSSSRWGGRPTVRRGIIMDQLKKRRKKQKIEKTFRPRDFREEGCH